MYSFKTETDLPAFESFVKEHGGWYLQSPRWADVKRDWNHNFYAGFRGETRVLTALVLERALPGVGRIWYSPAGAVCDHADAALLKEFADFMRGEMKRAGAAALFYDPCIELRVEGETRQSGVQAHQNLLEAGFRLNADASRCLYKAPVQLLLPLTDESGAPRTPEKLLKTFEKGVRYSVRVGESRGLTQRIYTAKDLETNPAVLTEFAAVMRDTSDRNDFTERGSEYIAHLMRVFGDEMEIMLIYYDKKADAALENARLERKAELERQLPAAPEKKLRGIKEEIESIQKQTAHYEERVKDTEGMEELIAVAGGLTVIYNGTASCLFGGARNLLRNNLRASHYFNFRRICRSIELGCAVHDLGYVLLKPTAPTADGTLAPCVPREDFEGINAFKKSFGGVYTEFIGEYVLVGNKARYFAYEKLFPVGKQALHVVNKIVKKKRS